MIAPLPLLELEEFDNFTDEKDKEIECLVKMLENILPKYVGV